MFNSRKTIKGKKDKLESLNQQLEALNEDYLAASRSLTSTAFPSPDYNRLERQLQAINEKKEEIVQSCDNLTEEILQLRLNELSDDTQQVIKRLITLGNCIALQTIQEAYRDVTQRAFSEIVRDLLLDLAEMAGEGEEDKNKPLWLFVNALRQKPSLIEYQKQELDRLLQEHNILEALNVRDRTNAKFENYLMVTIQYDPGSERCGLQAKLIIDEDAGDLDFKPSRVETLDPPPNNANDPSNRYSLKKLPQILGGFIQKCGKPPYKIGSRHLTLQLFLPTELMNLPIEHEPYQLTDSQSRCIGERCQGVVIRNYDRHFSLYEEYESFIPDWEESWRKYANSRTLPCQETLHPPMEWKNHPNGVGSQFVEPKEAPEQINLWEGLLLDGVPIALWVRQPVASPEEEHPLLTDITRDCPLEELPNRIREHRFENLPNEPNKAERIKKSPFCLLLDNPFRPFPYSPLESSHAQIQTS